jgi:hypothetical protein
VTEGLRIGAVALGPRPVIVAAGGEHDVDALCRADRADVVELRADLFADASVEGTRGARRLRAAGKPVVLTAAPRRGRTAMPSDAPGDLRPGSSSPTQSTSRSRHLVPRSCRRRTRRPHRLFRRTTSRRPRPDGASPASRAFDAGADVAKVAAQRHRSPRCRCCST